MCIVGPSSRKPSLMCRVNLLSPHSSSLSSQSAVGGEGSCCCSVAQSYPTLCDPMDCSTPGSPVLHHLKLMSIKSVMPSNHIVLCHPLLLLPSVFPSIRVFSNESAPRIRWPKFWSFSFSISPSSVYSGSISLGLTGLNSLQSKGLSRVFSKTSSKVSILQCSAFFMVQFSHPYMTTGRTIALNRLTFGTCLILLALLGQGWFYHQYSLSARIRGGVLTDGIQFLLSGEATPTSGPTESTQ